MSVTVDGTQPLKLTRLQKALLGTSPWCIGAGVPLAAILGLGFTLPVAVGSVLGSFSLIALRYNLPYYYLLRDEPEQALHCCEYLIARETDRSVLASLQLTFATCLLQLDQLMEAKAAFHAVDSDLLSSRQNALKALSISALFWKLGDPSSSLDVLQEIPEGSLGRAEVALLRLNRSAALFDLDQPQRAIDAIREIDASRLSRQIRAILLNNRAVFGIDLNLDPQSILDISREAVELWPTNPTLRGTLGAAMLHADRSPAEALQGLEASLKAKEQPSPQGRVWLLYFLGHARELQGDLPDAIRSFETALAIGVETRYARRSRESLQRLRPRSHGIAVPKPAASPA